MRRSVLFLTIISLCSYRLASATDPPTLKIRRVTEPPKLEDYLNGAEPGAPAIDGFIQREPDDGKPSTESTKVYLSYDDSTFYVVFVCKDSEPKRFAPACRRASRPSATTSSRSASIRSTIASGRTCS